MSRIIIDADLCIKLGGSDKYKFLLNVLPLAADDIYMHTCAYNEVKMPPSAVKQLKKLVEDGTVKIVDERELSNNDLVVYNLSYNMLAAVTLDPGRPNKNKGEVCSLAYAKATGITIFATDENNLQQIIDSRLNTGIDDIHCLRIVDIIMKARNGEIDITRKTAKAIWVIAGKNKDDFDNKIWPL
ncbi:MAG: hypothetical protein Q4D58_03740 [Synergistaceae bacterium]|nr:hypothetical protein [Synergistaceae bacterium]